MTHRTHIVWGEPGQPITSDRWRQSLRRRLKSELLGRAPVKYVRIIRHVNRLGDVCYFAKFGRGATQTILTLASFSKEMARAISA